MRKIVIITAFVTISLLFVTSVLAQTMPNRNQPPNPPLTNNQPSGIQQMQRPGLNAISQNFEEKPGTNSGMRPLANGKPSSPSGNLQQKCQTIEKVITDQAQKGTDMLIKIYQQLNSIFTGVQNYYSQKLVPSGVSLQNYEAVVSTVQASQSAVLTSIQTAQQDAKNFSCSGNQPGQQIAQFRITMQQAIKATIAYRDVVKIFVEEVLKASQNVPETTNATATNSAK